MTMHRLDPRLECAAQFVRPGAVFADIGTDHAYLPIALLQRGAISYAYAADVAQGPLATAKEHLDACAMEDGTLYSRIALVLTDGLQGLETRTPEITDIAVCGMGGELIARILGDAPFVYHPAIRLILQPMTMQPYLRRWLCGEGFETESERLCRTANGKLYSVICCHYTGVKTACGNTDALFGAALLADPENRPLLPEYLRANAERLARIVRGKREAGLPCCEEEDALARAESLLRDM
ncbi:MAG: SAM-dependent methyltransferase [Clostridia bacterium]|nr:SAM-dependent methyltransferase [Clostridia bacterium]